MKKYLVLFGAMILLSLFVFHITPTSASHVGDCEASGSTFITPLSSTSFTFTCAAAGTVYFGVCDNGGVPNDDEMTIEFMGSIVASNQYVNNIEFANIGQADVGAGTHSATINSLNVGVGDATIAYATSIVQSYVVDTLGGACGSDFGGQSIFGTCDRLVPVFTSDTAPSNGTLVFNVQFGEMNRQEGITIRQWDVTAGQRINNDQVVFPTPNWGRLWWQPDGDSTWYLLPSQYWQGDGTPASEYGLDCESSGVPSYHTSFGRAIPESSVPMFNPDG